MSSDLRRPLLFWDIETTDLEADRGRLVFFGATTSDGGSFFSVAAPRRGSQRAALRSIFAVLRQYPHWVTYNGRRFDVPFLFSVGAKCGVLPPTPRLHLDLYNWIRRQTRFSCRRLVYLSHHLLAVDPYEGPWLPSGSFPGCVIPATWPEQAGKCLRDLRATHNLTLLFGRKLHRRFPSLCRLSCPTTTL